LQQESILNEGFDQNDVNDFDVPSNYFDISLGFGFETQKKKHIILNYRIDFIYDFINYDDDFIFNQKRAGIGLTFCEQQIGNITTIKFTFFLFFVLRHFITERLSLALETRFDLGIYYGKSKIYDSNLSPIS